VIIELTPFAPHQIAALECLKDMGRTDIINETSIVTLFAVMAIKYATDL
jgi:hypothetical protein